MAGVRPSSTQLEEGLPIFFAQLLNILKLEELHPKPITPSFDKNAIEVAATNSNEVDVAIASGYSTFLLNLSSLIQLFFGWSVHVFFASAIFVNSPTAKTKIRLFIR